LQFVEINDPSRSIEPIRTRRALTHREQPRLGAARPIVMQRRAIVAGLSWSVKMNRTSAGALTLAALLATGPALATTTTMSTGLLSTYTGPANGDLEIASASAFVEGGNLVLSATAMAPIGTTAKVDYVWGIETDPATAKAAFASEGFTKVLFNQVAAATPGAAGVTVSGDTITDTIAISSLTDVTVSPDQFAISLWPVAPATVLGPTPPGDGIPGFSEFVPGNGTFLASSVPEPANWALMLIGFAGLGAVLRVGRRQSLVAAA
jgi:hypothetical protein